MNHGDIVDRANDLVDLERESMQAAIQAQAAIRPAPTGRCFYCDEIVSDDRRFCDRECASGFEREQEARKRNGIK